MSADGAHTRAQRDIYADIQKEGFEVYGISTDSPKSLKSWKTSKNFQYHLLSDKETALLSKIGWTQGKKCVLATRALAHMSLIVKPQTLPLGHREGWQDSRVCPRRQGELKLARSAPRGADTARSPPMTPRTRSASSRDSQRSDGIRKNF